MYPSVRNHTIDWERVTLPYKEPNSDKRGILEAIAIRKEGNRTLNRDSGRHLLTEGYTNLLRPATPPGGRKHWGWDLLDLENILLVSLAIIHRKWTFQHLITMMLAWCNAELRSEQTNRFMVRCISMFFFTIAIFCKYLPQYFAGNCPDFTRGMRLWHQRSHSLRGGWSAVAPLSPPWEGCILEKAVSVRSCVASGITVWSPS